jgi:hypothetical protein
MRDGTSQTTATCAGMAPSCAVQFPLLQSTSVSQSCKEIGSYSKAIQVLARGTIIVVKDGRHMKRIIQLSVLTFGAMFIFSGCGGGDEGGGGDGNSSQNDSAPVTEQSA